MAYGEIDQKAINTIRVLAVSPIYTPAEHLPTFGAP